VKKEIWNFEIRALPECERRVVRSLRYVTHRTLHSDLEETMIALLTPPVIEFVWPQILNWIDSLDTRGDLLDGSISVQRSNAADLWEKF
jgi:hypothetical protein